MDIIAYVIFVIGKLNHWQISRLSEKQSDGAAQCGGQLQFLRDALPEGQCAFSAFPWRDGANAEFDIAGVQSTALTS